MNNIKNYGPFQLWVLNNFPFTIDDWDSITQYQMLCKCLGALKEQLDVNSDLYQKISDLDNYIKNLDLQDEVNNKIDEMAESGQLQEIITKYLQINGVLAFDTVSNMVSATNIINGSVCKTLGLNTYNDGKGAFYKIRTITNDDVVDGVNIIAVDIDNSLIAELIPNYYINNLQTQINNINEDIEDINNILNRKILFIGDSYGVTDTNQWGTSWVDYTIDRLGLTLGTNVFKSVEGACGFLGDPNQENKTFLRKLQEAYSSIDNPELITDIIIGGGINDYSYTSAQITTAIGTFMTYAKTNFPNAKVALGMISWTKNADYLNNLVKVVMAYKGITSYGGCYIENVENAFHYNDWFYDTVHPISGGQQSISNSIINYIKCGTGSSACGQYLEATVSAVSPFNFQYGHLKTEQKGNIIDGVINGTISHSGYSYTFDGTWVKFATFTGAWLVGGGRTTIPTKCLVVDTSNVVHTFILDLKFDSNGIYFRGVEKSNGSTADLSLTIKTIIILETAFTLPALGN